MNYYSKTKEEIFRELETTENGLSKEEAQRRLKKYGKNELPQKKKDSFIKLFFKGFADPMEIILLITVVLSFIIGETIDACTLIFIILIDVLMGAIEEYKARKAEMGQAEVRN